MAFTSRDGKTQTALAEINMIPFIDVVLVLLIIFMITAPVIQSGIQVDVPETATTRELTQNLLVVTLDKSQTLYLGDKEVNYNNIASEIRAKLPTVTDKSVYFRADKAVTFEIGFKVMDQLRQAGVEHLILVTRPFEGKP
jgi:biopolymer transport protein ExbD/biopolymer transport protein TolR